MLLALVDAKHRFIRASLGAPGNTYDLTYFQSTSLRDEINSGQVLPDKNCIVDAAEAPPVIFSRHGAFPLRSWKKLTLIIA